MHRRPEYYGPDADAFRPERWETLRPGWEYLPFNGGPRICIGQGFALMEAAYTTVRLMQVFRDIDGRDEVSPCAYDFPLFSSTCSTSYLYLESVDANDRRSPGEKA